MTRRVKFIFRLSETLGVEVAEDGWEKGQTPDRLHVKRYVSVGHCTVHCLLMQSL